MISQEYCFDSQIDLEDPQNSFSNLDLSFDDAPENRLALDPIQRSLLEGAQLSVSRAREPENLFCSLA